MAAWKKARELTKGVYAISARSKLVKEFDLRRQMCRAAVSIASNIAEGFEREGDREFLRFLSIAKGSCGELRSHVLIAHDQRFISENQFFFLHNRATELSRILASVIKKLKRELKIKT
jgi:four helix bundle protein